MADFDAAAQDWCQTDVRIEKDYMKALYHRDTLDALPQGLYDVQSDSMVTKPNSCRAYGTWHMHRYLVHEASKPVIRILANNATMARARKRPVVGVL